VSETAPILLEDALSPPFDKIRHPVKRAFLAAYMECGMIYKAAKCAEMPRTMHNYWMHTDPDYAEAFALAHEVVIETHEDEASRRALGYDETAYTKQGEPYTIRKYSDTLLIFRLKALKPEMYRDSYPHDKGQDISDLLKAVLLELHRQQENLQAIPAEFQPLAPPGREPAQLPAPPSPEDATPGRVLPEDGRPW